MNELSSPQKTVLRKIARLRRNRTSEAATNTATSDGIRHGDGSIPGSELRVICLYPSVVAGKLAREWIEKAVHSMAPNACTCIEYFNYSVLSHDGISWEHVIERIRPDIILMVGDGNHTLSAGLRNSLRKLFSKSNGSSKPMVIFRDLEPEPTLNTQVLLDYVSALTRQNHCDLTAMNGNGTPISCFRQPLHLLKTRKYRE